MSTPAVSSDKIAAIRLAIVAAARAEIGYKETPAKSNKTKFGEWYELNAVAWCAIFVSWCYAQAGAMFGYVNTVGFSSKGFAHCASGFAVWARYGYITKDPQPGDIVLYDWQQEKPNETPAEALEDHTGIFIRWLNREAGTFEAIEGNTAVGNDSNGGEVMLRERSIKFVSAFVNILDKHENR